MKSVIQAAAVPVVKEVLQKHTQSDVVDKPFVDSKGRYRYFVVHHGSDNPQFIMAGTGRLQSNSYEKMAELTYIQAEMQEMRDNGTQWIFPVELYNNFPIGRSIYGTPNDPNVLLADRIINGEIFMPPALDKNTILSDEAWEAYKNGQLDTINTVLTGFDSITDGLQKLSDNLDHTKNKEISKYFDTWKSVPSILTAVTATLTAMKKEVGMKMPFTPVTEFMHKPENCWEALMPVYQSAA